MSMGKEAQTWATNESMLARRADRAIQFVRSSPLQFLLVTVAAILFVATYWNTLISLVSRWNSDANYSHGYLVPLASLYLLHQSLESRGNKQPIPIRGGLFTGSILLMVGLLLAWGTTIVPSLVGECASMLIVLSGAILAISGWGWWRYAWAPVLFLVFMVPWPSSLYSQAAFPLQLFVSQVAGMMLQMLGIPVICDGSLLHLPGQTMHVAQACSGLRQLTAFLAMSACAALLVERPMWYRITLLMSAVPIAILINILRVAITGILTYHGLGHLTEGTMHTVEGMVMILAGFGVMGLEIKLLDWLWIAPVEEKEMRPLGSSGAAS
ncbi:exosortase/archaeosortase family protein [bacterium]|nr:exosortase/archaeosortase family protein [bacterium]